jgi:hypothetical protein
MISRRGLFGLLVGASGVGAGVASFDGTRVRERRRWTEEEALAEVAAREEAYAPGGELSAYHHQHYVLDEQGHLDSHWTMPEMAERRLAYLHGKGRHGCTMVSKFTCDGMG